MYRLSAYNKAILSKKIKHYKKLHFPGKGSGARLAEEIDVPPQTVSSWLNGSRLPTPMQLYRLSIAFKVSPFELCGIRRDRSKSVELSLLEDMLVMMRGEKKENVNLRVTHKRMNEIKSFLEKVLPEIWNQERE